MGFPTAVHACLTADNPPWSEDLEPQRVLIGRVVAGDVTVSRWQIQLGSLFYGPELPSPFTLTHGGNCLFNPVADQLVAGIRVAIFELDGGAARDEISSFGALVWVMDESGKLTEGPTSVDGSLPTLNDLLARVPDTAVATPTGAGPTPVALLGLSSLVMASLIWARQRRILRP